MKFKTWLNIIVFILLALVIFFGWKDIVQAWGLLGKVNLWVFWLMIPMQLVSYYAIGEVMFSYLRDKGELKSFSKWSVARTSLELSFMNHIVPVPGAAGFSYLSWVLSRQGISVGRSTMAQMIRYVLTFVSFISVVIISVIVLTFDNQINRTVTGISLIFILLTVVTIGVIIFAISNHKRLIIAANWVNCILNKIARKLSRGKRQEIVRLVTIEKFFNDMHDDYMEIRKDIRILIKPFLWALLSNVLDVGLIFVAFLSLGAYVNPAMLFIAFGLSSIAGFFAVTPGGTGVYEGIMIAFLVAAGVTADIAIAGTLLARATLLALTLCFGYVFYQLTVNKYGKVPTKSTDL